MSDDNCYPWDGMKGHILPCSPSQCMATFTFHWSLHRHDDHQMFSTVLTDCKFLIQNRILPKVFILNCAAQRQVSLRCRNHINRHCHRLRVLASNTNTPTHKNTNTQIYCQLHPNAVFISIVASSKLSSSSWLYLQLKFIYLYFSHL